MLETLLIMAASILLGMFMACIVVICILPILFGIVAIILIIWILLRK